MKLRSVALILILNLSQSNIIASTGYFCLETKLNEIILEFDQIQSADKNSVPRLASKIPSYQSEQEEWLRAIKKEGFVLKSDNEHLISFAKVQNVVSNPWMPYDEVIKKFESLSNRRLKLKDEMRMLDKQLVDYDYKIKFGPVTLKEELNLVRRKWRKLMHEEINLGEKITAYKYTIKNNLRDNPTVSKKSFLVESAEIKYYQSKGTLGDVRATHNLSQLAGGAITPGYDLLVNIDASKAFAAVYTHEITHIKALAKGKSFRKLKNGNLRSHPFNYFISKKGIVGSIHQYDDFQHASEATAYRAEAFYEFKQGKKNNALKALVLSDDAVKRNLEGISAARDILSQSKDLDAFKKEFWDTKNLRSVFEYKVPFKKSNSAATLTENEFEFKIIEELPINVDGDSELNLENFLEYLDYTEKANLNLKKSNDKLRSSIKKM